MEHPDTQVGRSRTPLGRRLSPARRPRPHHQPIGGSRLNLDGLSVVDFTSLPSVRTRIVGSAHWVSDKERRRYGGSEYLLVREPGNEHDAQAIAVYGLGRKVGHLSAAKAASLASILDRLSADAYRVTGAGADARSVQLWVDLPRVDAIRKFTSTPS